MKVNDEVVAVNSLQVDSHPLTLDRSVEDGETPGKCPSAVPTFAIVVCRLQSAAPKALIIIIAFSYSLSQSRKARS